MYSPRAFAIKHIQLYSVIRALDIFEVRVLIRDLHFTARSLRRFTENEAVLKRSPPYIVTLELSLGVADHDKSSLLPTTDHLRETSGDYVGDIDASSSPAAQLDSSLAKLAAAVLPRSPRIRSLSIRARGRSSALRLDRLADLSLKHLTSLELDRRAVI
ncbi:hypothetical protein B0T26DRAFT_671097 [Lasiosphaeria miniovina]|uniref:Uncharacterized protein n=1 Tax=Lasiosphaeria miniovina TaxID=1954250 RepID=A0AA40EGP5_9PEZI|nr:uncharacterized protein B0T26DRAFT_671097 [Lasiosphaeria miniovina]KAK0734868.1 hypothetical protein B0T26DRAFT_671097 [Lasiosphaeria miniovina]